MSSPFGFAQGPPRGTRRGKLRRDIRFPMKHAFRLQPDPSTRLRLGRDNSRFTKLISFRP